MRSALGSRTDRTFVAESRISLAPLGGPFVQKLCRFFVLLVFQQLLNQPAARIVGDFDRDFFLFRIRQCQPAFDFEQRAGHHDEITGLIEVQELLQRLQIPLKLCGDLGDRQVEQIQFAPSDQKQHQVQRPGIAIKFHAIRDSHGRECSLVLQNPATESRSMRLSVPKPSRHLLREKEA